MEDDVTARILKPGTPSSTVLEMLGKPDYLDPKDITTEPVYVYKLYHNTLKGMAPIDMPTLRVTFDKGRLMAAKFSLYFNPSDDENIVPPDQAGF
jgi:hypothetical protein